jgi:hypothetical protein
VPEGVRGDVLTAEGRAGGCGCGGVLGDEAFDGVAGQAVSGPGGEQRIAGVAAALGEPGPQDGHGSPGQRGGAVEELSFPVVPGRDLPGYARAQNRLIRAAPNADLECRTRRKYSAFGLPDNGMMQFESAIIAVTKLRSNMSSNA